MPIFWMDQYAAWSVVILSVLYASRLSWEYLIPLLTITAIAIGLSYSLCVLGSWDRSSPVEHAAIHATACLGIHVILAGL